jgi:hypothetical protein
MTKYKYTCICAFFTLIFDVYKKDKKVIMLVDVLGVGNSDGGLYNIDGTKALAPLLLGNL